MTPSQELLLQKAQNNLRGARLLASEKLYDLAISRAYYAMFYIAEAFLIKKEMSFSSHSAVISAFGQYFARTGLVPKEFHRYLIDAQDLRNRSDYEIDSGLTEQDAIQQIELAQQFIELATSSLNKLN